MPSGLAMDPGPCSKEIAYMYSRSKNDDRIFINRGPQVRSVVLYMPVGSVGPKIFYTEPVEAEHG
jgi:hypothetical protein